MLARRFGQWWRRLPFVLVGEHFFDMPRQENHVLVGPRRRSQVGDMTTAFDDRSSESELDGGDTMVRACEACGHDSSSHDATATRFCRVSQDRALDRACICREPAVRSGSPMYGRGRFSGK